MWSSTNQRIKALNSARARERERLNRPIHVLRADVALKIQNAEGEIPVHARALLNEFTPNGIQLYATASLMPNVDLTFEIDHPRSFKILGRVVWCQYQSSHTHVLTQQTFPYRVGIAFKFASPEEEAEFKKFCEEMHASYCQKGPLKVLGDPTVQKSQSLTGNFTPENLPPATGDVTAPSVETAATSTETGPTAADSAPADGTPPPAEENVLDVLNQLGVEVPEEKKAA